MGSLKPAVRLVTSPAMTVLTQQILSPRLSLINNNNNHIQTGKRLKRSWSTGSGDKILAKNLPDISDITDGFVSNKLIEVIPDLLSNLMINSNETKIIGTNNNESDGKVMENIDFELDIQEDFEPGVLGLLENPGVISFDSLDYPNFGEELGDSEDELVMEESVENIEDFSRRMLRFSLNDLMTGQQLSRAEKKLRTRTKSLSDINEMLDSRQYSHRV